MKRYISLVLSVIFLGLVFLLPTAEAVAIPGERKVTFEFKDLLLDRDDVYEEDGVVYADGRLVIDALNLPELTLSDLPLLGKGSGGKLSIENLTMGYLDSERIAVLDPDGEYGFDEDCMELSAVIRLDAAAVERVLGLNMDIIEKQWEEQSASITDHWIETVYEAFEKYEAGLAYGDQLCLSPDDGGLVEVVLTKDDNDSVVLDISCVSWGLEALVGRMFESWTNVGFWVNDFSLTGEINHVTSNIQINTNVSYLLYELTYPYPDHYTCWVLEGTSLLPPSAQAASLLKLNKNYQEYVQEYEGIPRGWNLKQGEELIFHLPAGWYPKSLWEPYGPREATAGGESNTKYDLSKTGVNYKWESNTLHFNGPLNMESWAKLHNNAYWKDANGLPWGMPYIEVIKGEHPFTSKKGVFAGIIGLLFVVAVSGLFVGGVMIKEVPQQEV